MNEYQTHGGHHVQPHDVDPSLRGVRVALAIKNFATIPGVCHIGLGVTAANTMKVLRRAGIQCETWSLDSREGKGGEMKLLWKKLEAGKNDKRPVTHIIVSAPSWILPINLYHAAIEYPDITFVQLNHSGAAYLSIDKNGIHNIKGAAKYQEMTHNVKVAANNERVAKFITGSFGQPALLLPNLYDTQSYVQPFTAQTQGNTLRIGSFGASRPWKNQLCAAEAAVMIGRALGRNIELYVNSKRPDGGERMIESRNELFDDLPHAKIVDVPWAAWPDFRDITGNMHLLIQPSFDETFNVCTADGIAEGVPSVTTSALEWTPRSWWAAPEDPHDIMNVGIALLHNPAHAISQGRDALTKYVAQGLHRWVDFLTGKHQVPY